MLNTNWEVVDIFFMELLPSAIAWYLDRRVATSSPLGMRANNEIEWKALS